MKIILDDLHPSAGSGAVAALLQQHIDDMLAISPPESVHALDLDSLRQPNISFWSVWIDQQLAGCGALKQLDPQYGPHHGEIKSMRTADAFRQQGVATTLLRFIIDHARQQGYQRLSLETGSMTFFAPARSLYEKYGFAYCPPFADYIEDPYSQFMTKPL